MHQNSLYQGLWTPNLKQILKSVLKVAQLGEIDTKTPTNMTIELLST